MEQIGFKNVLQMPVDRLDLTVRASNCLRSFNIVFVGDLVRIPREELIRIPNMGRKSLRVIEDELQRYNLELGMDEDELQRYGLTSGTNSDNIIDADDEKGIDDIEEFIRIVIYLRDQGIESMTDLVKTRSEDLLTLFNINREELDIITKGLEKWNLSLDTYVPDVPKISCNEHAHTFKEELLCIVNQLLSHLRPSHARCLIARHGIGDGRCLTLEEIGNRAIEYGFDGPVTRERVRQVTNKAERFLRSRSEDVSFSLWESSMRTVRKILPIEIGPFLSSFGYETTAEGRYIYEGMKQIAADIFGLEFPFDVIAINDSYIVLGSEDTVMRNILNEIEQLQPRMYIEFAELVGHIGCEENFLKSAILVHPRWEFLDHLDRYLWRRPNLPPANYRLTGNLILTCLFKIFSVVREARTIDLIQSIPRHRLISKDVPTAVLEGIANRSGLFDVQNGRISPKQKYRWAAASERDLDLLRVCIQQGQIVSSKVLYSSLVQYGMSRESAAITVAYSPFLVHTQSGVGHNAGIYKFVCQSDHIELEALEKGVVHKDEIQHDGRWREGPESAFLRIPVTGRVKHKGKYYISEGANLDGKWKVQKVEGEDIGYITISGRIISGLMPIVDALFLEKGDTLELIKNDGDEGFIAVRS